MKTIVINLLGAAGSGKSLIASEVFAKIKRLGISCENIQEYAKGVVYEENYKRLKDQLFVYANQYHSMKMAQDSARVLVLDSPLILSLFYNKSYGEGEIPSDIFESLVMDGYNRFDNINYFIIRNHEYKQEGRYQDEAKARQQEQEIKDVVEGLGLDVKYLKSTDNCAELIVKDVLERLKFLENMQKQGKEIERKFLLKQNPYNLKNCRHVNIVQAYIKGGEREVRIRAINGKRFYLTEKTGKGKVREENEKEISKEEFLDLYKKSHGRVICKKRYFVPVGRYIAEVDFYKNRHQKLKTVEVEFSSEEEADVFAPPEWFGDEVTKNEAYKNYNLACK